MRTKQITWMVEKYVSGDNADKLKEAALALGFGFRWIVWDDDKVDPVIPDTGGLSILYCSMNMARALAGKVRNDVLLFGPSGHFDCASYYPYFGEHLLDAGGRRMTWKEMVDGRESLGERFFVRPDGRDKLFPGVVMNQHSFLSQKQTILYYRNISDDTPVFVAAAKPVEAEYRLVVCGDRVIAGSRYMQDGMVDMCPMEDRSPVMRYGNEVLSEVKWRPALVWVMDVCKSDGEFKVLEIGCFSCSDLACCVSDAVNIVREVSATCMQWYGDQYPAPAPEVRENRIFRESLTPEGKIVDDKVEKVGYSPCAGGVMDKVHRVSYRFEYEVMEKIVAASLGIDLSEKEINTIFDRLYRDDDEDIPPHPNAIFVGPVQVEWLHVYSAPKTKGPFKPREAHHLPHAVLEELFAVNLGIDLSRKRVEIFYSRAVDRRPQEPDPDEREPNPVYYASWIDVVFMDKE